MKPGAATREQRLSNLLTREENECIFSLFGTRCESLATTVVQVFVTNAPEHCDWSKLDAGVLCLVKDHLKRSYYFRLYCPERRCMVWEHEVYNSMQYNAPRPFLHTFEAQDCIVAFNFASEEEAKWLRTILLDKLESKKQRREKRLRNSYHAREQQNSKPPTYSSNGVVSSANKYSVSNQHPPSSGFTNHKDEKKKNKKKDDKKLTKADIGNPTEFRHISHVGWDINKGFDASLSNEESPELKEFFQQAGVSEIQLQDRATRDFIYEFIQVNGGLNRVVNELQSDKRNDIVRKDNHYPTGTRHERDGLPGPPPLPMRNTPLPPSHTPTASRAAPPPPPPPSRTMPAPPPPTQNPPPPPPLRILPQQPPAPGSGAPPPPPPPPMPSAAVPPPPALLPATLAPDMDHMPSASDPHSALMESIRSGTTLKKVDLDAESRNSNDSRGELLTQIRQGISLRPVQPVAKPSQSGPPENSLASALAIALAERSRFIHSESSGSSEEDENEDDDEWED
uniref:WH1 domain-containing protein n=2 Tax=Graphocephala atropunctata TaxID=36148 RepID=A0A1B6MIX4_9HEMI